MSMNEHNPRTCRQCEYFHQIGKESRWICSAPPPQWDGYGDPGDLGSWFIPQTSPEHFACHFFMENGERKGKEEWKISGKCGPAFTGPCKGDDYCYIESHKEDESSVIATVWNYNNQGKKNAALIAAAPEMYKMLEKILDRITMGFGKFPSVDEMAKVIDKARGE